MEFIIFFTIIGVFFIAALVGFYIARRNVARGRILNAIYAVDRLEVLWRDRIFAPIVRPIARTGIHPNTITLSGMALSVALAAEFFTEAHPILIFIVALVAALSDMFDGMVARAAGKVTALGGILDGVRDFFLYLVLTIGILVYHLAPPALIAAFFAGNALVGFLKLREIFLRMGSGGLFSSVARRGSGEGKLSIDRIKFVCFAIGCLAALLGHAGAGWAAAATPVIFWAANILVLISVAAHSVIIVSLQKQISYSSE